MTERCPLMPNGIRDKGFCEESQYRAAHCQACPNNPKNKGKGK